MKKDYEAPKLILVELVAEETISLGCWRAAPSSC